MSKVFLPVIQLFIVFEVTKTIYLISNSVNALSDEHLDIDSGYNETRTLGELGNVYADGQLALALPASSLQVVPCSLRDPNKDECIKNLLQQTIPKLKSQSFPEYGLNSIDPYLYKRGIFRYANEGIQGGLLIKNMNINGISDLKVNSFVSNFTKDFFIFKLNVELPHLQADGQFKADVKFGGLRLVPKGPFNITIDNIKATILTNGMMDSTPTGKKLRFNQLNANIAFGYAHIVADGIFSDKGLNNMILNLINEKLPEITRVGIPATREQWAPVVLAHINEFFSNVPSEKFLLD